MVQFRDRVLQLRDLPASVQDRRVIATTEVRADLGERGGPAADRHPRVGPRPRRFPRPRRVPVLFRGPDPFADPGDFALRPPDLQSQEEVPVDLPGLAGRLRGAEDPLGHPPAVRSLRGAQGQRGSQRTVH